jgi:hypothetical protein
MGVNISTKPKKDPYAEHLAPSKIKIAPGVAQVTMEKTANKEIVAQASGEEIVHKGVATPVPYATVTVAGSRTIQPKPFESVKLHVELCMPSHPDHINQTYEFVSDWVGERLEKAIKDAGL